MRSPSELLHFGPGTSFYCKTPSGFSSIVSSLLILIIVGNASLFVCSSAAEPLRKVPTLKILEYDEAGKFVRNTLSIYPDSDLVLGDEYSEEEDRIRSKKIVLECSAIYPVQFHYEGSGVWTWEHVVDLTCPLEQTPDYIENSVVDENHFDEKTGKSSALFSTSLSFPKNLQEHDTGKYTCTNMITDNISSSVFLFIPGSGKILFASSESIASQRRIFFSRNESTIKIQIPCGVTHPNVLVSLHKFDGAHGLIHYPQNESLMFNPKSGFLVSVNSGRSDPSGIYVCAAAVNDAFQFTEYQVIPLEGSAVVSNALADLTVLDRKRSCFSENDCSADRTCIARQCQSPCNILPKNCGVSKQCEVVNHKPLCINSNIGSSEKDTDSSSTDVEVFRTDFGPQFSSLLRSACNPTVCGRNAECVVIEYKSYCVCFEGYTGNGRISCHRMDDKLAEIRDPCSTTKCGLHTMCTEVNGHAVCSCLPEYNGYPPHCKEETYCSTNYDCPDDLFCGSSGKCEEPCESFDRRPCAQNAVCQARNHDALCFCKPGFTGNPHSKCVPVRDVGPLPSRSPCQPSPCGQGASCRVIRDEVPYCYCPTGTRGNPRVRCYSTNEKLQSSTTSPRPTIFVRPSSSTLAPQQKSPCEVTPNCAANAQCRVVNGFAACKCYPNYYGDPYTRGCYFGNSRPNSQAESSHHPGKFDTSSTTTTKTPYLPPTQTTVQRKECRINQNCPENKACYNFKCVNPCLGSCGSGARCKILNHTPLCSCPEGTIGDGLVSCRKQSSLSTSDPCASCGPNSNCKIVSRFVHCECNPWSTGTPPKCRRSDCNSNEQCPADKACIQNVCVNPCTYRGNGNRNHTCAPGAHCKAWNHEANCVCPAGFSGDGRVSCKEIQAPTNTYDPCERAPCGEHSTCHVVAGLVNYRRCTCNEGYHFTYYGCKKIEYEGGDNPCRYSPCGPHSLCSSLSGVAYCHCDETAVGTPPFCAPKLAFSGRWSYIPIIN